MDPARKRALRRQYKQAEIEDARRRLGLTEAQLRDLRAYVASSLDLGVECDRTSSRTLAWARAEGLDPERTRDAVADAGGRCDCEVLMNVRPYLFGWPDAPPASADDGPAPGA